MRTLMKSVRRQRSIAGFSYLCGLLLVAMGSVFMADTACAAVRINGNPYAVTPTYSSRENDGNLAWLSFDGNGETRWATQFLEGQFRNEWLVIDLGQDVTFNSIKMNWETATAAAFTWRIRTDAQGLPATPPVNGDRTSVNFADWIQIASITNAVSRNNANLANPDMIFDFDAGTTYDLNGAAMTVNDNTPVGRYLLLAISETWSRVSDSDGCSPREIAIDVTSGLPSVIITHVATDQTGEAGAFTGPEWRTETVVKPNDGDGDHILGTDGWKWFGYSISGNVNPYDGSQDQASLPAYIGSVGTTPGAWEGSNGWALFDDPLNPGSDKQGTYASGASDYSMKITRAGNQPFRLTLFGSAGNGGGGFINNRIKVTTQGGSASGIYNVSAGQRWYMYFDIGEGSADILVNFERLGGDDRGLTAIAFDSIIPISITHVATDETGFVGRFTGPEWRTETVSKSRDVDGDNILGTDGWKWFGYSVPDNTTKLNNGTYDVYSTTDVDDKTLPSYIASVGSIQRVWAGNNGWALFDDPLKPGLDKRSTYAYSENNFSMVIGRATNQPFRLTLFGSAGDGGGGFINTRITVSSTGSSASGTYNVSNGERWYMYFDIGKGWSDITVNVQQLGGDQRGLTGMAFDSPPLEVPTAIILMDDTTNDGSFESVSGGGDKPDCNGPIALGSLWTIVENGVGGWLDRPGDTILISDGTIGLYQDVAGRKTTVTSIDILGTGGYSTVALGDKFTGAFDINGNASGTASYSELYLSFDGGSTWKLVASQAMTDANESAFQTGTGTYKATADDVANAAANGLKVKFEVNDVDAHNWSDNVRLSVKPYVVRGMVILVQ